MGFPHPTHWRVITQRAHSPSKPAGSVNFSIKLLFYLDELIVEELPPWIFTLLKTRIIWGCLNFCCMFSSIETSIAAYTWWVLKVILYGRWRFFGLASHFEYDDSMISCAKHNRVLSCFGVVLWHNHPTFRQVSDVWFEMSTFARVGLMVILAQPVLNFIHEGKHKLHNDMFHNQVHCRFMAFHSRTLRHWAPDPF